jgi:hypothetical protein
MEPLALRTLGLGQPADSAQKKSAEVPAPPRSVFFSCREN